MKKLLILLPILLLGVVASAQSIKTTGLDDQDLKSVVSKMFDVEMEKFDLSSYLDKKRTIGIYIDEYSRTPDDSLKKERVCAMLMGSNRSVIKDAESIEHFTGSPNFNTESNELTKIESITLAAMINSDTTARLSFTLMPTGIGGAMPLDVITLEQSFKQKPIYSSRPFKFEGDEGVTGEIPLLLYGSFYYDEKYDIMRFCGEREISPDISSEIVKHLPHFYVVGVIIKDDE